MEPRVGKLIKTIMPVFPEEVFPADSHILKDAIVNKQQQLADKVGKYGSVKSIPAGLTDLSSDDFSLDDLPTIGISAESFSANGFQANSVAHLSAMSFTPKGFSLDSALPTDIAAIGLDNMSSQEAVFAASLQKLSISEKMASATQNSTQALAVAGITPEIAAQMNPEQLSAMGLSPKTLASPEMLAKTELSPEKLAAVGITPEMAAQMNPEQLSAMGLSPEVLASPEMLDKAGLSSEKLAAAGITPEMAAQMNPEQLNAMGLSPEALASPEMLAKAGLSPEKLAAAGITPEMAAQMNPEQLGAMGLSPEVLASPEMLAKAGLSPEKLAAVGITPEMAAQMNPEKLNAMGLSPKALASSEGLAQVGLSPEKIPMAKTSPELTTQITAEQLKPMGAPDASMNIASKITTEQMALGTVATLSSGLVSGTKAITSLPLKNIATTHKDSDNTAASIKTSAIDLGSPRSIVLLDELANPVCGQKYEILLPDGTSKKGSTDENGAVNLSGSLPRNCTLLLSDLDEGAW